jgi:hypothetical protein
MSRSTRWLALGAVLVTAALVGPTAALADNCHDGSATSIYTYCPPTATGKPKHHHPAPATPPPTTTTYPTYTYTAPTTATPPPSRPAHHAHKKYALDRSSKDKPLLSRLIRAAFLARPRHVKTVLLSSPAGATTVGSEFDLGSGPTILLVLLIGSVLALFGAGGVRSWRNRHRA